MLRVGGNGVSIALEIWKISASGLVQILQQEPPGLTVGHVHLRDGATALGVLAEPYLVEGQTDITDFGGWRAYLRHLEKDQ